MMKMDTSVPQFKTNQAEGLCHALINHANRKIKTLKVIGTFLKLTNITIFVRIFSLLTMNLAEYLTLRWMEVLPCPQEVKS